MNKRYYYYVPFSQDAPKTKHDFLVAHFELIPSALEAALNIKQLQPVLA